VDSDDVGASLAGAVGGLLNWLTTPSGKRALAAGLVAGAVAGYGASALLRWHHPDIPPDVRMLCSCFAGLLGLAVVSYVTDAAVRARIKAIADERLGVAPDGPNPTAGSIAGTGAGEACAEPLAPPDRDGGVLPAVGGELHRPEAK
jgi:hypothetical protein